MDLLLLSIALSSAPLAPVDTLAAYQESALDPELAQAVLMAEHRLSMPIFLRIDSQEFRIIPAATQTR